MSLTTGIPSKALADHQEAASRARAALTIYAGTIGALYVGQAIADMEGAMRCAEESADRLAGMLDEAAAQAAGCVCGEAELGDVKGEQ